MFTSLHPKAAAIVGVIVALGVAAQSLLDGNPATNPDWSSLATVCILAYGVFRSRQNNVTSEQVTGQVSAPPKP